MMMGLRERQAGRKKDHKLEQVRECLPALVIAEVWRNIFAVVSWLVTFMTTNPIYLRVLTWKAFSSFAFNRPSLS